MQKKCVGLKPSTRADFIIFNPFRCRSKKPNEISKWFCRRLTSCFKSRLDVGLDPDWMMSDIPEKNVTVYIRRHCDNNII